MGVQIPREGLKVGGPLRVVLLAPSYVQYMYVSMLPAEAFRLFPIM